AATGGGIGSDHGSRHVGLDARVPVAGYRLSSWRFVAWANNIVRSLRDPVNSTFFRMLVSTHGAKGKAAAHRTKAIRGRRDELQSLLERARKRGEPAPEATLLVEVILAPLYTRALFGEPLDTAHAKKLVGRLLRLIDP